MARTQVGSVAAARLDIRSTSAARRGQLLIEGKKPAVVGARAGSAGARV
jgi:hypothetical protein